MRIIYRDSNRVVVRTYAAYHYVLESESWFRLKDRDRPISLRAQSALNAFLSRTSG